MRAQDSMLETLSPYMHENKCKQTNNNMFHTLCKEIPFFFFYSYFLRSEM